jgi:hypothetical protein
MKIALSDHPFGLRFRIQTPALSWRPCRAALPRGVHALPSPPRRKRMHRCEDGAGTSPSLVLTISFPLCFLLRARAVTGEKAATAFEQFIQTTAPLANSSRPPHHREPLHLLVLTEPPLSPQVGYTAKAAPPGHHVRRRRARTWPCHSSSPPPYLSHALGAVRHADACRIG